MIKLLNLLVETTQGLNYHLKHKLPLSENIYRYSSKAFLELFTEARTLDRNGFLQLCEADRVLLQETDIGQFGSFQGKNVPLDMPMIEMGEEMICRKCKHRWEVAQQDTHPALCHNCAYDNIRGIYDKQALEDWKAQNEETNTRVPAAGEQGGYVKRNMIVTDKNNNQLRVADITNNKIILKPSGYSGQAVIFPNDYDQFAKVEQFWDYFNLDKINEAKYHGKDVQLGKPHRGGSKKFFVYVRDPKTKNIKKVNFGDTTGLSVKIDDPKARHSFAARHKCATEKNKLSANYWGCHIGRYWKSLGGEKNFSGYW